MGRHGLAVDGVLVSPMLDAAFEVMVGAHLDPVFGPVVVLGAGGTHVEAAPDLRVLLPPFSVAEARRAIGSLRMAPLLAALRGEEAADVEAWATAATRLGEAMVRPDCPVASLDVNPLMLFRGAGAGVTAADAVVIVER
jgi:acetate---CoA ligase (ADP-forming)